MTIQHFVVLRNPKMLRAVQRPVGNPVDMSRKPKLTPATAQRTAFATRLVALRHAYGAEVGQPLLNQGEFARLLNLEDETYRRYERGETEPPLRVLAEIRRLTGISLNNLIAGEIDRAA